MPVLENPRHESFAQNLAKGMTVFDSYTGAGLGDDRTGTRKSLSEHASRLRKNRKYGIEARTKELQRAAARRAEISIESVLLELAKIGFANIDDFIEVDPHSGAPLTNFKKSNRDQRAAISEVTVEEFVVGRGDDAREVRKTKFKLADKRAALVDLGKHLGAFASDAGSDTTITIRVEGGLPVVPPASKSSDD